MTKQRYLSQLCKYSAVMRLNKIKVILLSIFTANKQTIKQSFKYKWPVVNNFFNEVLVITTLQ